MMNEAKTLKDYAKEAKRRLKTGYWQRYSNEINKKMKEAERDGVAPSKIIEYYSRRAEREIHSYDAEKEAFYLKVKKILDEVGEAPDIIGRLTDKKYYATLSYEQKQRYTLELSEKYRVAQKRYYEEKQYE